ncbi:unnamed protein product [Chondrus crispus]|uniref:Uncharacterized protein n=1 Tax=Chondrus crispus TaxID=2769 RepID=R7QC68_CHOCR|nr:unnamed protein product [Chondrus crispus]CDF35050.1 unnamed protein product [Chondrus crispus]|eukprot:XP_005714869.1 unnamed protein product [Chondrus crispus]
MSVDVNAIWLLRRSFCKAANSGRVKSSLFAFRTYFEPSIKGMHALSGGARGLGRNNWSSVVPAVVN